MTKTLFTPAKFADCFWQPPEDLAHAKNLATCEIVMMELPKVLMELPIFIEHYQKSLRLVALMSPEDGKNNCIQNTNNKWLGNYVPAALRQHPFEIETTGKERRILVKDGNPHINNDSRGQALFAEDNKPSTALQSILTGLNNFADNRILSSQACKTLYDHGYLKPWTKWEFRDDKNALRKLFCVDESITVKVTADALPNLFKTGALWLAHSQLLSMHHINKVQQQITDPKTHSPSLHLNIETLSDNVPIDLDHIV